MLPRRRPSLKSGRENAGKRSPAHCNFVRSHFCSVPGCEQLPIEVAHVRNGTGGGMGVKPSDRWTLSLCRDHHSEQHRLREETFEKRHGIDMKAIAEGLAKSSPHWPKLKEML